MTHRRNLVQNESSDPGPSLKGVAVLLLRRDIVAEAASARRSSQFLLAYTTSRKLS
jgi:hypothetical protein